MFTLVLDISPRLLTLSARDHALINASMGPPIAQAFRDRDWTCHICGVRLEGLMEVDHLKGHRTSAAADIAPICQFCHDLKHPVWAMSRKRAFPVYAPEITQSDLTRFAWTLLSEMTRTEAQESFEDLLGAISERESAAFEMLDGENMEAALEAILVIRSRSGAGVAGKVAQELDAHLRYLPSCVRDGEPLQRWTPEGFRDVPLNLLHDAFGAPPDLDRLSRAAAELTAA